MEKRSDDQEGHKSLVQPRLALPQLSFPVVGGRYQLTVNVLVSWDHGWQRWRKCRGGQFLMESSYINWYQDGNLENFPHHVKFIEQIQNCYEKSVPNLYKNRKYSIY